MILWQRTGKDSNQIIPAEMRLKIIEHMWHPGGWTVTMKTDMLIRDSHLTKSQNYQRLGLVSKLNNHTGGTERPLDLEHSNALTHNHLGCLNISSKPSRGLRPLEAQVQRDPTTGHILRVISGSPREPNPLNDPLNHILEDGCDDRGTTTTTHGIVKELEEQASMEVKKRPRQQSEREEEWISNLVQKYGDNYMAMVRDRKLNPFQQTEGDLRRRVKRWKEKNGG